ncbi:membrane-fusion protein [Gracilibacillus halophilus YIM-C55.5]|uniref:Membrane-fusion protein n=1 Tax=Gracilibacillus halophilus YIM-C55.5 TaxID=1308866 RepID=N4WMV0_9BACI|nr:DUF6773 family protein [Gracilibacillus halophilus]ENH95845.1 membrane-fusion protein [Gracilibacillus halophilus YIM-C55.5]
MLFRKYNIKDEHIIHSENKIYREMYYLVLLICYVSIIMKAYLHGFQIEQVYTELTILFSLGIYFAYRSARLGIFSGKVELHNQKSKFTMERKQILIGLIIGLLLAASIAIRSAILYSDGGGNTIYVFIIVFIGSIMIYVPFFLMFILISYNIMKRKSDKVIAKQLQESDEDGDTHEKY